MTQRIAQLIGYTSGCQLRIIWNGDEVFSGDIPAAGNNDSPAILAQWETDTEIVGDIPLVLTSLQGEFTFVNIHMNMFRAVGEWQFVATPNWTQYTPEDTELFSDYVNLSVEQIQTKYGLDRSTISQWIRYVELVSMADHFEQPLKAYDFTDTDGKESVAIDGVPKIRHSVDYYNGPWHWPVYSRGTLTCNFRVDRPSK